MAKLVILTEGLTGRAHELNVDRTTIGRVEDNMFQIAEASVSSHHCEVHLRGSEILILDSQYTDKEYQTHIGWGHGSISSAVSVALEAEVQTLLLFHHDPSHDDNMVDTMVETARELVAKSGRPLEVAAAKERREILLKAKEVAAT